jgi:hypothetical protein
LTKAADEYGAWFELIERLAILLDARGVRPRPDADLGRAGGGAHLKVVPHLRAALALGDRGTTPICACIDALRSPLRWQQNTSYRGAAFLDGYAYCELLGPHGLQYEPDLALGLLLLAPQITYPEHAHPAAEVYAVLAGRALWRQGDGIWRERVPGERIRHASMEPHATRTSHEPLLAAYLWQDHLDVGARLVDPANP